MSDIFPSIQMDKIKDELKRVLGKLLREKSIVEKNDFTWENSKDDYWRQTKWDRSSCQVSRVQKTK